MKMPAEDRKLVIPLVSAIIAIFLLLGCFVKYVMIPLEKSQAAAREKEFKSYTFFQPAKTVKNTSFLKTIDSQFAKLTSREERVLCMMKAEAKFEDEHPDLLVTSWVPYTEISGKNGTEWIDGILIHHEPRGKSKLSLPGPARITK